MSAARGPTPRDLVLACPTDCTRACPSHHRRQLFKALPTSDGTLDYRSIIDGHYELMKRGTADGKTGAKMKDFLVAMAWTGAEEPLSAAEAEQSGWVLSADDAESLRVELRKLVRWHTLKLSELFAMLDTDTSGSASWAEFERTLVRTLGFDGDREVLRAAFEAIDADTDGEVRFRAGDVARCRRLGWTSVGRFGPVGRRAVGLACAGLTWREWRPRALGRCASRSSTRGCAAARASRTTASCLRGSRTSRCSRTPATRRGRPSSCAARCARV